MHLKQWLMIGTMTSGALLGSVILNAPAAVASAAPGDVGINGDTIFTSVTLSGNGHTSNWPAPVADDWTPPTCWLEPNGGNSGWGASPAETPTQFGAYIQAYINDLEEAGVDDQAAALQNVYKLDQGAPASVQMITAPYNTGQDGMWYQAACGAYAVHGEFDNYLDGLGIAEGNHNVSAFWIPNGGAAPDNAAVLTPEMLAEYAAASVDIPNTWPTSTPNLVTANGEQAAKQTVNSPLVFSNPTAAGYQTYVVQATLALAGLSEEAVATPQSILFSSPSGNISETAGGSPESVSCALNPDGAFAKTCQLYFLNATSAQGSTELDAEGIWQVDWAGHAGAAGWPKKMDVQLNAVFPTVQEIQTIVGNAAPAGN